MHVCVRCDNVSNRYSHSIAWKLPLKNTEATITITLLLFIFAAMKNKSTGRFNVQFRRNRSVACTVLTSFLGEPFPESKKKYRKFSAKKKKKNGIEKQNATMLSTFPSPGFNANRGNPGRVLVLQFIIFTLQLLTIKTKVFQSCVHMVCTVQTSLFLLAPEQHN